MKKIILLLTVLMTSIFASAQDTIKFVNGRVEAAKVMEVGLGKIKYKKYNNPDGPLYLLDEAEVASVKYHNGDVEVFNEPAAVEVLVPAQNNHVVFQTGPVTFERITPKNPATYPLKYYRHSPSRLMFDSSDISEQEAYRLLGPNYEVFRENVTDYRIGRAMWITGAGLVVYSFPTAFVAWLGGSHVARHISLTSLGVGVVLVPIGVVKFATGKAGWKRIVKEYNLNYNEKSNSSAELRFGVMENGVGMNLTF